MSQESSRREFIKSAAIIAAVGAVGDIGVASAAQAPAGRLTAVRINRNAKAVLPDGSVKSRADILTQLGFDPNTPPDAWLAIFGCGSNAAALQGAELKGLVDRGTLKRNMLDAASVRKLREIEGR